MTSSRSRRRRRSRGALRRALVWGWPRRATNSSSVDGRHTAGVAAALRSGAMASRDRPRWLPPDATWPTDLRRPPPRAGQPALDGGHRRQCRGTYRRAQPWADQQCPAAVGSPGAILPLGGRCGRLRRSVPPDYVMGERERRAIRCRHPLCGVRAEREAARASTHPGRRLPVRHRPVRRLRRRPPRRVPQRVASAVDDGSVVRFTRRRTPTDPTRPAGRFPGPGRRARHDLARPGGSRHRSGAPSCARRSGSVAASSSSTTASGSSNTWRCPHLGMVTQRVCSGS